MPVNAGMKKSARENAEIDRQKDGQDARHIDVC